MIRLHSVCLVLSLSGLVLAVPGPASAQRLVPASPRATTSAQAPASGRAVTTSPSGLELGLLRSLQANPATAPYGFSTERRGSKIALRGRVGTKQIHDVAIQTAIALGVPVIDDLVIDTLAAHQAASFPGGGIVSGQGVGYPSAGPSSGMGYPGANYSGYGSLPYTYPQPLFGRLDDPFFGFEPPAIGYPSWWGALTARRLGPPMAPAGPNDLQADAIPNPNPSMANPPADPSDAQAASIPDGTIDMAIDPRGVATLRGTVPTLAERITLGQKVAQTPGVTQVVNLLNVKAGAAAPLSDKPPPPPVPADLTPVAKPPVVVSIPNEPAIVADNVDPVGQKAARAISNRAGLANQSVKVKVRDGVASLTGKVPTVYEAMLAFRAVQRTPGVREVEDRLEFVVPDGNGPNPLADKGRPEDVEPYLEAQIRRQVGDLAHIDRVRVQGDNARPQGAPWTSEPTTGPGSTPSSGRWRSSGGFGSTPTSREAP